MEELARSDPDLMVAVKFTLGHYPSCTTMLFLITVFV
jgi:hypothetical protein